MIATVIFYCFFITGIFAIFAPGDINDIKDLVYAIFPPLAGRYWYISCYVAAYFLFPYINTLIDTLNSGQRKKLFLVLVVIFSIIPNLLSTDLFGLDEGYSTAWLIICYILGSIIAREKIEVLQGREFLAFLGISAINMTIIVVGQLTLHRDVGYMLGYTSPLTLLSAIFVLQWAKRIQIKSMKIKSVIFSLSSFVFDVYILHCHYLVFDYRILDSFTWVTNYGMFIMVILIVSLSVSIYLFGSLIGIFRKKIFKLFRLNKLFSRVTIKIDKQLMM